MVDVEKVQEEEEELLTEAGKRRFVCDEEVVFSARQWKRRKLEGFLRWEVKEGFDERSGRDEEYGEVLAAVGKLQI